MAVPPSIKGRIFGVAVEDANKLLASGELVRAELPRWLQPDDLPFLTKTIGAADWYDVACYARFLVLLRDVEGYGSNDYLKGRGKQTADRLLDAGLYSQMEYLSRAQVGRETDPEKRSAAFGRDLKLLTTLSASILSFTQWSSKPDPSNPGRYVIEVTGAEAYPEALGHTSEGFLNGMAHRHGGADLWKWSRARPDLILFKMVRAA
jgi:hypothetical protein